MLGSPGLRLDPALQQGLQGAQHGSRDFSRDVKSRLQSRKRHLLERSPQGEGGRLALGQMEPGTAAVGSLPAEGLRASLGRALGWGDGPQEPGRGPQAPTRSTAFLQMRQLRSGGAPPGAARPSPCAAPGRPGRASQAFSRKEGMAVEIIWNAGSQSGTTGCPRPGQGEPETVSVGEPWRSSAQRVPCRPQPFAPQPPGSLAVLASLQEAESGARSPLQAWGAKQGREQAASWVVWIMERIRGPHGQSPSLGAWGSWHETLWGSFRRPRCWACLVAMGQSLQSPGLQFCVRQAQEPPAACTL